MILCPDLPDIEKSAQSDAERSVARLLAAIPDAEAVAFHSVKVRSHAYKQMAEADFVILWKGVVIVVEVKGGGVMKHEGVWYTVDRNRDTHKLTSSPMEQARSAMFALRTILREEGVGWFASEAIVITPSIDAPPSSPEWKSSHWLAAASMTPSGLAASFSTVAQGAQKPSKTERIATARELRSRLFGEFSRMPIIDAQRGAILDEQNRATDGQARVLGGLARNPRIMVRGGAGTGKSLVLAEAAKQEAGTGRSVLITFRSPGLREFFRPRVAGRSIDVTAFEDLRVHRPYDVLLVDEAQDLMSAEAMDILDGLVVGGMNAGRWRMFVDPNNQAHVDGRFDKEVFELVEAEAFTYDLSLNVRNTKAIVHMVQEYLGADVGDPGIVNGERVQWQWSDKEAGVSEALSVAKRFVSEGVRSRDIWIVPVASEQSVDEIHDGVRVLSPRNAKGLEADHVIVCGLPPEFDDRSLAAFYVAVTRARVSLHIVANNADKKQLLALARKTGR